MLSWLIERDQCYQMSRKSHHWDWCPRFSQVMSSLPYLLLSSILSCLPLCLPLSFTSHMSTSKPSATNIKRSAAHSSAQGSVQAPSINTPSIALTSGTTEVATPTACAAEYYDLLNLCDPVVQPILVSSDYGAQIWGGDAKKVVATKWSLSSFASSLGGWDLLMCPGESSLQLCLIMMVIINNLWRLPISDPFTDPQNSRPSPVDTIHVHEYMSTYSFPGKSMAGSGDPSSLPSSVVVFPHFQASGWVENSLPDSNTFYYVHPTQWFIIFSLFNSVAQVVTFSTMNRQPTGASLHQWSEAVTDLSTISPLSDDVHWPVQPPQTAEHVQLTQLPQSVHTNEWLQQWIQRRLFKSCVKEYTAEGISQFVPPVPYFDNMECIRLLQNRHGGLVHIMDDQARWVPKKADQTMVEAFGKHQGNHSSFKVGSIDRPGFPTFTIHHFNGPVIYSSKNFLERNLDVFNPDSVYLLRRAYCDATDTAGAEGSGSINPFIDGLFLAKAITIQAHPWNEHTIVAAQQPVKPMHAPSTCRKGTIKRMGMLKEVVDEKEDEEIPASGGIPCIAGEFTSVLDTLFQTLDETQAWNVFCINPSYPINLKATQWRDEFPAWVCQR